MLKVIIISLLLSLVVSAEVLSNKTVVSSIDTNSTDINSTITYDVANTKIEDSMRYIEVKSILNSLYNNKTNIETYKKQLLYLKSIQNTKTLNQYYDKLVKVLKASSNASLAKLGNTR